MVSFIRMPFMLVCHQSKCISAIKRILFYYRHVYILVQFRVPCYFDACLNIVRCV